MSLLRPTLTALMISVTVLALSGAPPALAAVPQEVPPPSEYGRALRTIMTAQEARAWSSLTSDADRQAFIESFWEQRDPTPGSDDNEVRQIFERRLARATRLFGEGDRPGYVTDRGRVLLTLGLPDEQEMQAAAVDAAALTWTYERGPRSGTLGFVAAESGYELLGDVELDGDTFLRSVQEELRGLLGARLGGRQALLDPAEGAAGAASGGSALAEVAPEVRVWLQLIFGDVARDDLDLRHRVDFFPAAEGTYTVLSFKAGKRAVAFVPPDEESEEGSAEDAAASAAAADASTGTAGTTAGASTADTPATEPLRARLKVFGAVLEGEEGAENTLHQFIIPYRPSAAAGSESALPTRTLAVTLYPGTYRLAWGLLDEETGLAVTRDETLIVPDFNVPGLRITRPLIARPPHREESAPIDTRTLYRGVRLGRVLIADDLDRTFGRDDTIEIVAVAIGWDSDPAAPGKPRLEVTYRILEAEGDRSLASVPPQVLDFSVLGQQIPLSQVNRLQPGAEYRIQVHVRDLVSGAETVQEARILIAETPGAG